MKLAIIAVFVVLSGNLAKTEASDKKASLGLLNIFNHFLTVSKLVDNMPTVLQTIANDIVDDIRRLIPEVEKISEKYNATEPILTEIGNALNMTRVTHELLPELEKILDEGNITETIEEIVGYLDFDRLREEYLPELDKVLEENNVSKILDDIKELLNVTVIADMLLPEIESVLEDENVTKLAEEVRKILDMTDISGKLIPNLEKIFESHNVSQIVHALDDLLNLTKLAEEILPELSELFEGIKNETLPEIRKFLDMAHLHGLLDELEDMLHEANITHHVPDLEPFLNISIVRSKLTEIEKILDHFDVHGIIDELERLLDVDHLISKVPEFDEFLEDLGLSKLLQDFNELIEMSFLSGTVTDIKEFLLSANLTNKINDLEKLLNVSYLREVIVPEIERMVEESNVDNIYDEARQFLNTTFLIETVIPEIEKIWDDLGVDEQIELLINLTNMTFLRELIEEFDKEWSISLKGKQVSEGDLAGVVNGVLDELFATDEPIVMESTKSPTDGPTKPTEEPTLPPVCDQDCAGDPCGDAIMNNCDECVLGKTGKKINHGTDCSNVCGGTARNDSCGYCSKPTRDGRPSAFADCNGDCSGLAYEDSCGNCTGGNTGKREDFFKDVCGVCGGDGKSCLGCDGVPNSGKVNDSCNVCGGDGSSCITISAVEPSLLPTTSESGRVVTILGAGLDGDSVKCVFDGEESTGTKVDKTHCQCTIPSGKTAGEKVLTVKVVQSSQEVPTKDLKMQLYDPTSTKITSLSPSELFIEQETILTFAGNGLIESSSAVCLISANGRELKLEAKFQNGGYGCKAPASKNSFSASVALSLNAVHKLASEVNLTRVVYAPAPEVVKSTFTATGALIGIAFNKPINTAPLQACADVFSTGLTSLGRRPKCKWADSRLLVIASDVDATIVPTNSLTFKTGSVKRKGSYAKAIIGSVEISAPDKPVRPLPIILGPDQISSCGHLKLNGKQSSGGGGRNLRYEWSLVSPSNAGITTVLNSALDKSSVLINGTLMTSGSTYTFKLTVKNFLNSTGVSSMITVAKARDPLPEVTVHRPRGKIYGMNSFYVAAKAKAASCSSSTALTFSWSVRCTSGDSADAAKVRVEASDGYKKTSGKFALKITPGALLAGRTYEFTVVVALKATPTIKTTVKTSIEVEWSPLQPAIVGGDRTVGRGSGKLRLDAKSSTRDPDNADGDLFCSWTCFDKSIEQPCYSAVTRKQKIDFPNDCIIEIDSEHFQAAKIYKITSQVSKGSRSAASSIVLSVVAGKPPAVNILASRLRVVASARVKLEATYKSSTKPVKVEWFCEEDDEHRYIDLSDTSLFANSFEEYKANGKSVSTKVLKANVLSPGGSYKFTLRVNDGSNNGSSSMVVTVRNGPTSGSFEVSSTVLIQLEEVTLKAPRWVTDDDAYPLKYQFGVVSKTGVFKPWITQADSEYTVLVPPATEGNLNITLRLRVKDSFGSMQWMDQPVRVTEPSSIDESKIEDLMKNGLKDAEDSGDFSTVVPNMKNILKAIKKNTKVSALLKKNVVNSTVTSLILAVKSTSLDQEKAKPIFDTFLELEPTLIDTPSSVLDGFDEVVRASKAGLDKETIKDTLGWLGGVSAKADHKKDPTVSKNIVNSYESLADGLLNDVELGQTEVVTSDANPNVEIKVSNTLLDEEVAADGSSDATKLDFGSEMAAMCQERECSAGKICIGCPMKVITYKEDYFNDQSADKPDIVTDKIISVSINNQETGDERKITGLKEPFKIKFKTGNLEKGKTRKCYYFDPDKEKWSQDGITSVITNGELECSSTHLTSFSPADATDNSTQSPSSDKIYQVSLVLSNTTWDAKYSNSSDATTKALQDSIIAEINEVYKNDSTFKSVAVESFQDSNGKVQVVLKMVFSGSNKDPSSLLKASIADGKLGQIAVDPNSLKFDEKKASTEEDGDDIALIIGLVAGISFAIIAIVLLIAYLVYRSKKKESKVDAWTSSQPHHRMDGAEGFENKAVASDHEMTPV